MACLQVDKLLYLSWSEESSTVFEAKFDKDLWDMIINESVALYESENPKRPTRLSPGSKDIKSKLSDYRNNSTKFLCEVSSVKGTSVALSQTQPLSPYIFPVQKLNILSEVDMPAVLTDTISALKESYQLCRKKASEVLVWLLNDTDRIWHPEIPNSLPISYAMKGYSLSTITMREMHDDILQHCHNNGIKVLCSCFDGQWIKLATRDENDKPLTLLQLQKDVWVEAGKLSRESIISNFTRKPIVRNVEKDILVYKKVNGELSVSCPLYGKLVTHIRSKCNQQFTEQSIDKEANTTSTDDVLSCLPDEALDLLIDDNEMTREILTTENAFVDEETENLGGNEETLVTSNQNVALPLLSDNIFLEILDELKNHKNPKIKQKWTSKGLDELKKVTSTTMTIKSLTHDEMNVIIFKTSDLQKKRGVVVKKSWRIQEKANALSRLIGSGEQLDEERFVRSMLTLKEFAARKLKSSSRISTQNLPKNKLNILYSTLLYPEMHDQWVQDSPFTNELEIENVSSTSLFSYPGFSNKRHKYEPMCVDAHHLLVNLRVKVCKDGLKGIRKEAWHNVAEQDRNIISKALVIDLIDKQNNGYAQRTFSKEVEQKMMEMGHVNEAEFCNIVREWYEAEDSPGISACDRACRRLRMKAFLLRNVDFGTFPPYGMYINGFTRISYEGFLQKIDTSFQLYALSLHGTYNQRSISSLTNETFFGELSEMEETKLGCPKAISIPRLISTVTEILHYRCDPSER